MRHDPNSNTKVAALVDNLAISSTFTEDTVVDTLGFRFAHIIVPLGAATGTAPTLSLQIEAGAVSDGSSPSDITGAVITADGTDDDTVFQGVIDLKKVGARYLSCTGTIGGTTPSFTLAVLVVLSDQLDSGLFTKDTLTFNV